MSAPRVALVTGAAGGIGQALSRRLAAEGYALALCDREDTGELREALRAEGALAESFAIDLLDGAACDALPGTVHDAMGGLHALCNNAGIITRGPATEASDADWARSMAINAEAPFRLCRAAIPLMAAGGGGAIVNTGSCWGLYPGPNHPIYCASKSALITLSRCLARDHAHQGIRINCVCPNEVDTPMLRSGFAARGLDPARAISDLDSSVPLGYIARPEEIAETIAWLVSDAASYVCGAALEVNGAKPVI